MNFKSQIATTVEQSEKLIALGLKKETADMHLYRFTAIDNTETWELSVVPYGNMVSAANTFNESYIVDVIKPAWSLHRLIEMLPPGYREQIRVGTTDNPYEYMYQVIGRLVYVDEFNKKYLEK